MQFYTVAGAIVLLISALEGARMLNRGAEVNLSRIDGCISLVRYARTQIDCYALAVDEIFTRCDEDILCRCGYYDEERPKDFIEFFDKLKIKNKVALRIVSEFSADFGKHYREEQLKRCDVCISELEELRSKTRQDLANRKKLNVTLCLSSAATLIILLI